MLLPKSGRALANGLFVANRTQHNFQIPNGRLCKLAEFCPTSISICDQYARLAMDLRQVFATNLRRFRHEKGLSQEALADLASINRTYISKLGTGSTWAGLEIIGKLAKILGDPPADFLIPTRASADRAQLRILLVF